MRRAVFVSALRSFCAIVVVILCLDQAAFAAHPLITDDTGTQGSGRLQLEVNGEYANDNGNSETTLGVTLSAGALKTVDIVLGVPYVFISEKEDTGDRVYVNGLSDMSLELKWRVYEKDGLSLALKPGVAVDTGDEEKDIGDGKPSYSLYLIATRELDAFTVHANIGYILNREEMRNIWHYSLAAEYAAAENFRIVGNIGGETNPDEESAVHPLYLIGGVIYSVSETLDVDCGVKTGLNKAEADYSLLAGMAYRF